MSHQRWPVLLALAVFLVQAAPSSPAISTPARNLPSSRTSPLPKAGEIKSLTTHPRRIALKGIDDAQQLILTAELLNGQLQDLTGDVKYEVADKKVVRVTSTGRVIPLANGTTEITAAYGDKIGQGAGHRRELRRQPADQLRQPDRADLHQARLQLRRLPRQGRAARTASSLSLLGFEPEVDYNALVKEARGRRLFPAARTAACCCSRRPAAWPTAAASAWRSAPTSTSSSAAGSPPACPSASRPIRSSPSITVYPEHRIMTAQQPPAVRRLRSLQRRHGRGRHPPGPVREQRPGDRRRRRRRPGPHAGHERRGGRHGPLQGQVAVFRATVPLGMQDPRLQLRSANRGRPASRRRNGRSSASCRRSCAPTSSSSAASTLDLTGTLPTPAQVKAFVADKDPNKRDKLVDRPAGYAGVQLLLRQQVGRHPARQARATSRTGPHGTFAFHELDSRQPSPSDKPYDSSSATSSAPPATRVTQPADRVVQGVAEARAVRGRHRPGVPRPAPGLRPVPPPPLREVEPGRLLGPGRLLRPRRPQERADARRASSNQQAQAAGDLQPVDAATSPTSAPASRP